MRNVQCSDGPVVGTGGSMEFYPLVLILILRHGDEGNACDDQGTASTCATGVLHFGVVHVAGFGIVVRLQ